MPLKIVHQRAGPSLSLNALTIFVTPSATMISARSASSPPITMTGRAKSSNPPRIISTPVRWVAHVEDGDCVRRPWMTSTTPASSTMRPRIEIAHPPALKGVMMAIRPNTNNSAP